MTRGWSGAWPQRIVVVGTSGSGKTTTARRLASALELKHVELDALYWGPQWTERADEVFLPLVSEAVEGDGWVVDGNYSKARALVWPRAQAVVWLDLSRAQTMKQLLWRTIDRAWYRRALWQGNRESWRGSFCSRDSVLWWAWTTYERRRREYPELLSRPEHRHLQALRLRHLKEVDAMLRAARAGSSRW